MTVIQSTFRISDITAPQDELEGPARYTVYDDANGFPCANFEPTPAGLILAEMVCEIRNKLVDKES